MKTNQNCSWSVLFLASLRRAKNDGGFCRKSPSNVDNRSQRWALHTTFQLANVALGISEGIGQLLLTPASIEAEPGKFCTERLR